MILHTPATLMAADARLRRELRERMGVQLIDRQVAMVDAYVRTGRLNATGGRGAGKTFTLFYLAALELEAGFSVLYRTGLGAAGDQWGRAGLSRFLTEMLGAARVADAVRTGRLRGGHGHAARTGHAAPDSDLRDEAWGGGSFSSVGASRTAQVGSLPIGTLDLGLATDNPHIPPGMARMIVDEEARSACPQPADTPHDDEPVPCAIVAGAR